MKKTYCGRAYVNLPRHLIRMHSEQGGINEVIEEANNSIQRFILPEDLETAQRTAEEKEVQCRTRSDN